MSLDQEDCWNLMFLFKIFVCDVPRNLSTSNECSVVFCCERSYPSVSFFIWLDLPCLSCLSSRPHLQAVFEPWKYGAEFKMRACIQLGVSIVRAVWNEPSQGTIKTNWFIILRESHNVAEWIKDNSSWSVRRIAGDNVPETCDGRANSDYCGIRYS